MTEDQKPEFLKPFAEDEKAILDFVRLKMHLAQVKQLDSAAQMANEQLSQVRAQQAELKKHEDRLVAEIVSFKETAIAFVAEAKEQVGILRDKHGIPEDQLKSIVAIPQWMSDVDFRSQFAFLLTPTQEKPTTTTKDEKA